MTLINAYLMPLTGGVLLGLSAMWLLLSLGRIAGISGIAWGSLAGPERAWHWLFLTGLLAGGLLAHNVIGQPMPAESAARLWLIAASGLLVGLGTHMGGGCTSGHGVCGLGRRSPRSLVATATLMTLGVVTVFIMQSVMGGAV
ncbi:MAG: YeeE/YedE family protein [Luminiphilus sp.]|nr:YeeE/YedE family protein [Luminiphilus sp.]